MRVEIPNVLIKHAVIGAEVPAVFDSPHSGLFAPDDFGCIPPAEVLWTGGVDNHVEDIFADVPRYGGVFIEALYLRSYVDPNRNENEIDPSLLDEPWPDDIVRSARVGLRSGLIWSNIPPDIELYDRKLSVAEVKNRIERYWRPYQTALKQEMVRLAKAHGSVWHLNCHSNRSYGTKYSVDGDGHRRPDMELGTLDDTACAPEFTDLVRNFLKDCGYGVQVNVHYKGNHLVRGYSDPANGHHSMMIEIRKDLYMDEKTLERNKGYNETKANMSKLAKTICEFAKAKASS
jgi:N-formylglutamate deformylase